MEGPYVDGKEHGHWVFRKSVGTIWASHEGPFVDGKRHGRWVVRGSSGDVEIETYVNGEKQ